MEFRLSRLEKVVENMKDEFKKELDALKYDISLLQDPDFHGFNLAPRNYFIPKINMRMFDANYPLTWIFRKDKFFEIMVKQLRN